MEDNYAKAYKEVVEILNNVPQESVDKIPTDMIEMFKLNMDKNYEFKIDMTKSFENQVLMDETRAILANIFRDYWATPYQRERINEKEKRETEALEKEKLIKYNPEDLFKNNEPETSAESNDESLPVVATKENFFQRLVGFIKRIFKK